MDFDKKELVSGTGLLVAYNEDENELFLSIDNHYVVLSGPHLLQLAATIIPAAVHCAINDDDITAEMLAGILNEHFGPGENRKGSGPCFGDLCMN